jgi:hypothetical protein
MITDSIGGRKFLVGIMLLAVGVALEIFSPRGLTSVMATFLVGLGVSYFTANVTEKHVTGSAEPAGATDAPQAPPPPAQEDLKPLIMGIANQNTVIAQTVNDVAKGTAYLTSYVQAVQGNVRA